MNPGISRIKTSDKKIKSLLTALPATFMSAVSMTYILMANEGMRQPAVIGYPIGIVFACVLFGLYPWKKSKAKS